MPSEHQHEGLQEDGEQPTPLSAAAIGLRRNRSTGLSDGLGEVLA